MTLDQGEDMDSKGRRYKTENEQEQETPVVFAELTENQAQEERLARQREKQSKKIEKLMQKKRKRESKNEHDDAPKETPAEEPAQEDTAPADTDEQNEPIDTEPLDAEEESRREEEKDERLKARNSKRLEKLMQKKRKREDKSDREVLSYEDMPLNEREEKKKKTKVKFKKKRIIIASLILVVLVGFVYILTNNDRLSMHNIINFIKYEIFNLNSDERFPVELQGETVTPGNFQRMGQDLCYVSNSKLQTLNNYGVSMLTTQHGYSSPVLVCSDKYSLVYNLGGTGFQINSLDDHEYTGTAENNIVVADIVKNGTYALVTQSDGYLSKLYVYDDDNDKIFAYSFADYYITAVSLKSNGKMAVVSGISALNGSEIASLYVLDFTRSSPVQFVELEDTIIYEVQYLGGTYAAAIGSNGAYVINTGNGSVNHTPYEGKTLTAYTFNTDTDTFSVSLSRSGDGRNCDIYSFSSDGSLSKSFSTDLKVISISSYKSRVALLTTDHIYLYSKGGDQVGRKSAGIAPRSVVLYTSADAYVLETSEIRGVSF